MTRKLSLSEYLLYSTIRIECIDSLGNVSTGTGFYFSFLQNPDNDINVPVIITNKHVVEKSVSGKLLFTLSNSEGKPLDRNHHTFDISNFENVWRFHPDPDVDLCAMPIAQIVQILQTSGKVPFYVPFVKSLIPSKEQLEDLGAIEDIVMVGYPNGIWDHVNNQPIVRKGITATHPNKDYCGKKEFMADIASFPGSSGSPVLILNENNYKDKNGNFHIGKSRVYLLGILYAGPQHTAAGEIVITTIPTKQLPIPISRIPNHLGLIIKSERILELESLFKV